MNDAISFNRARSILVLYGFKERILSLQNFRTERSLFESHQTKLKSARFLKNISRAWILKRNLTVVFSPLTRPGRNEETKKKRKKKRKKRRRKRKGKRRRRGG